MILQGSFEKEDLLKRSGLEEGCSKRMNWYCNRLLCARYMLVYSRVLITFDKDFYGVYRMTCLISIGKLVSMGKIVAINAVFFTALGCCLYIRV